jgi:alpha-tubulin suppressor-like RCC1 family protein
VFVWLRCAGVEAWEGTPVKHQKIGGAVAAAIVITAVGAASPAPAFAAKQSVRAAVASAPGAFVPLTPARILDTRHAIGGPTAKVPGAGTRSFDVLGEGGVPGSNVTAVVLNVTVTNAASSGFITAFPGGGTKPTASNLNYAKGQTVANLVTVGIGGTGQVSLYNGSGGSVDLLADVAGYYVGGTAIDPGMFKSTAPTRLLDTRSGLGAPKQQVASAGHVALLVGNGSPVPPNAAAVVLNVTATKVTKTGFVTVYPTGSTKPTVSNLNYTAGRTVPNLVTVALGTGSSVTLYNGSSGPADLIADVAGYYLPGTPSLAGAFVPVTPKRILDTRSHLGVPSNQPVDPAFDVGLQTVNVGGIPLDNVGAVVANVTATAPTKSGFVTVSPTNPTRPNVSNINHAAGQTIANLTIVPPGLCSKATLYNGSSGSTHLLADVAGYFLADDASAAPHFTKVIKSLGGNSLGDLGDGTVVDSKTPVNLVGPHDTRQVDGYGLAVTNDGGVWAWGPDELGQLYANKPGFTDEGYGNCSIAQKMSGFNNKAIVAVAGSPADGYALDIDGNVWSWGFNDVGQLGRGTAGVDDFAPGKVVFAGNHTFTDITAGFALRDDGTVWGWGDNADGQLGVNPTTTPFSNTAVQVAPTQLTGVTALAQAGSTEYALMGDSTVMAWGSDFHNLLADGTPADSVPHPTPTHVLDVAGTGNLTGVSKLDGGLAVLNDDSLVTWGLSDAGQLGNGGALGQVVTHPVVVSGGITVDHTATTQNIATSETGDVVLATDGKVWAWGAALANGGNVDSSTPAQIALTGDVDDTVISIGAGFESSFAVITGPLA